MISHGWMDSFRTITSSGAWHRSMLSGWRSAAPSAVPLDVGRVVGSECKSGNVAGRCGRMLGGCERVLFVDVGGVVWLPVLEDKSRTEKQYCCRQCSELGLWPRYTFKSSRTETPRHLLCSCAVRGHLRRVVRAHRHLLAAPED